MALGWHSCWHPFFPLNRNNSKRWYWTKLNLVRCKEINQQWWIYSLWITLSFPHFVLFHLHFVTRERKRGNTKLNTLSSVHRHCKINIPLSFSSLRHFQPFVLMFQLQEERQTKKGLKSNFLHDNCTNVRWQMLEEKKGGALGVYGGGGG